MKKVFFLILFCLYSFPFALAQEAYPTKPIEITVGFAPGGTTDGAIRITSSSAQKHLGGTMIIINKPGASGAVAAKQVSIASPNGYSLLGIAVQHVIFPALSEKATYTINDFEPVARLGYTPLIMVTNPNSPWKKFDEVIEYARKNPGKLKVAGAGSASPGSIFMQIIKRKAKMEINFLPFTSEAEVVTSVLGGHADICQSSGAIRGQINAGKLRPLAVTTPKRLPWLPEVPTYAELGHPDASIPVFVGLVAPPKTPKEYINKISKAYEMALKEPGINESLEKISFFSDYLPPNEFQKSMVAAFEVFKKISDEENIKIK